MANVINATSTGNGGLITTGDDSGILNIQTNETTAVSVDASQNVDFTNVIDAPNTFGFKNRIINGGMSIDQRNSGASYTPTATSGNPNYSLDRWNSQITQASKFTVQRNAGSVTPPAGFINYLGITSSSAYSVGASDYFVLTQLIEGLNIADLGWGTANAQTVTLSFRVYSSLTGTFSGSLTNDGTLSYVFNYTISAANTWTTVSVTIVGPTSGTWLTTNGIGMFVRLGLGCGSSFTTSTVGSWTSGNYVQSTGSTSVVGTNGATFYITGVQLEKGTQATSFDFRDYGRELILCQRYYQTIGDSANNFVGVTGSSGSYTTIPVIYPVRMRAAGSVTLSTSPSGAYAGGIKDNAFYLSANQATMVGAMLALISSEL